MPFQLQFQRHFVRGASEDSLKGRSGGTVIPGPLGESAQKSGNDGFEVRGQASDGPIEGLAIVHNGCCGVVIGDATRVGDAA